MIEERAEVVGREGRFVWVETQRRSTCEACGANKGCGTATLGKVLGRRRSRVRALDAHGAQPGESVIIAIREDALLRGSLALYFVPLVLLLVFAAAGQGLAPRLLLNPEPVSILAGAAGLLVGFAWVRRFTHQARYDQRYQPVVLRRLG